jgi:chromosome segregation ATPase
MKIIVSFLIVVLLLGVALYFFAPGTFAGIKQWITGQREQDMLKHWEDLYQEKLGQLNQRLESHRNKLYDLRVEAKKAEIVLEKLQEKQKNWDGVLKEFADQLKKASAQVVFKGKTYTLEQAKQQFQSFLQEMVALKKQITSQEEQIRIRQETVQEYEKAVTKLEQEADKLKRKAAQLLLEKKTVDLKEEARELEQAVKGITEGKALPEYQGIAEMINLLEGDLLEKVARSKVSDETPAMESLEDAVARSADTTDAEVKSLEEMYLQGDSSEVEQLKEQYLAPTPSAKE